MSIFLEFSRDFLVRVLDRLPHSAGQPSHIAMAVSEGQLGDERSWNGHLLQCFGSCDHTGMSTAAYVHSCAPVAWG